MYYLSTSTTMSFQDAVAVTKQALGRHRFQLLAEFDLVRKLTTGTTVKLPPYVVLCTCSPMLTQLAISMDSDVGSVVFCNVVVQQLEQGEIRVSVADPMFTVGTTNHLHLARIAEELRWLLEDVLEDISETQPSIRTITSKPQNVPRAHRARHTEGAKLGARPPDRIAS